MTEFLMQVVVIVVALAVFAAGVQGLLAAEAQGREMGPGQTGVCVFAMVTGFGGAGVALYAMLNPILPF